MSKTKRALENNELLVACLKSALKNGNITIDKIKEWEKQLKRDFPSMNYNFSELYDNE